MNKCSYDNMKNRKENKTMKKTYKIEVDCANCANKMEDAAKNTAGVKDATVNFMTLKMNCLLYTSHKSSDLIHI